MFRPHSILLHCGLTQSCLIFPACQIGSPARTGSVLPAQFSPARTDQLPASLKPSLMRMAERAPAEPQSRRTAGHRYRAYCGRKVYAGSWWRLDHQYSIHVWPHRKCTAAAVRIQCVHGRCDPADEITCD